MSTILIFDVKTNDTVNIKGGLLYHGSDPEKMLLLVTLAGFKHIFARYTEILSPQLLSLISKCSKVEEHWLVKRIALS